MDFDGHGSLGRFQVKPYSPELLGNNKLAVLVRQNDDVMRFILDSDSLKTIKVEEADIYPPAINAATEVANPHLSQGNGLIKLENHVFEGKGDSSALVESFTYLGLHSPVIEIVLIVIYLNRVY